jgi:hypothetical protein
MRRMLEFDLQYLIVRTKSFSYLPDGGHPCF